MYLVDLFIEIHILTGKFPDLTKSEAKVLKELLLKLHNKMDDKWEVSHKPPEH